MKQSDTSFHMTYGQAVKLLKQICENEKRDYCVVTLSSREDVGDGRTSGLDYSEAEVGVGNYKYKIMFPANELFFTKVLVGIHHEYRHADQYNKLRYENMQLGEQVAIVNKAFRNNLAYYGLNYQINACEIDAERYGITQAYVFCKDVFGESKANKMICAYVNNRVEKNISFVNPRISDSYTDIMDVLVDFDKVYDDSIHAQRKYDVNLGLFMNDTLAKFLCSKSEYKDIFINNRDGLKQDKLAAAIEMEWSGSMEYGVPGLQGITISSALDNIRKNLPVRDKGKNTLHGMVDYDDEEEMQDEKE